MGKATKLVQKIFSIKNEGHHKILRICGLKLKFKGNSQIDSCKQYPADFEPEAIEILEQVKNYTMTDVHIMYAMYQAVVYIEKNNIQGDIVECGVWKGGSCMIAALILKKNQNTKRKIYLYDTFEGMVAPKENDRDINTKELAIDSWNRRCSENNEDNSLSNWCAAGLEEVKANMARTGYSQENVVYVQGKVQDTVGNPTYPMPENIALLRLDTDWYESTKHELEHFYPRLAKNGVLIIDDYGQWQGQKEAADEFFKKQGENLLLNKILGARMAVKI